MPDGSGQPPLELGRFGRIVAAVLRWSRRRRGWRVDTREAFEAAVITTAVFAEACDGWPEVWSLGRSVRLAAVHTKMIEILRAKCGQPVHIWQLVTDAQGAVGEASLGYWIVPFRINLRIEHD